MSVTINDSMSSFKVLTLKTLLHIIVVAGLILRVWVQILKIVPVELWFVGKASRQHCVALDI